LLQKDQGGSWRRERAGSCHNVDQQ